MCAPRWFQRTSCLSRRPIGGMCVLIFWTALRGSQNSSVALSQVTNQGLWSVRLRDKTPNSGGAHCKLSTSQESENEQIQNQIDTHSFFWQSGVRPQGICVTRTNCQSKFCQEVLERLRKRMARVRPGTACTWMLHHDNSPCHTAVSITEFLAEKSILWFLSPLFAWSQSLWLLFIPPAQKPLERAQFWYYG